MKYGRGLPYCVLCSSFLRELFVQQSKMKVGVMENCNTISMCVSKR